MCVKALMIYARHTNYFDVLPVWYGRSNMIEWVGGPPLDPKALTI